MWAGQFRLSAQGSTSVLYASEFGHPPVWTSGGAAVPNNNVAAIGYFDAGFDVFANANDLDALAQAWNAFDTTFIFNDAGEGGHFTDQATSTSPLFVNQQIWLWVFKTSDNSAPDVDYGDVTEYGLFTSNGSNWRFRPLGSFPANHTDIYASDIIQSTIAWGSLSGGHLNLAQVAPVPEPAVAGMLLLGLGAFGIAAKQRRR